MSDRISDVYYKIYMSERLDWKLTIVCMQHFDEDDYYKERFFTDEKGWVLIFETEKEAQTWLNENVKPEKIDPEYLERKFDRESYLKIGGHYENHILFSCFRSLQGSPYQP